VAPTVKRWEPAASGPCPLSVRSSPATAESDPPREVDDEHGFSRPQEPSPARRLLTAVCALLLATAGIAFAVGAFSSGTTQVAERVAFCPTEPDPVPNRRASYHRRDPAARS
jgi:hypothetical protein